ncbi:MAG: GNAT family N-acetyltransferase [Clostridia bacterium]|nr:GNAT family N-acetyltransferase [Clostridia bacterium]
MIYYQDEELVIRDMEDADAQVFFDEYTAQGWHPEVAYYRMRIREHAEGKCVALTAVYQGCPAGAVYVYWNAKEGPFKDKNWPYIVDFSVLQKYQRRGVGSRMMDAAELIAAQHADIVCLGVGLCREYGSAQRMYARRGYIPDGSGVWYQDKPCVQYETVCTVDDDLVLYMTKKLHGQ